MTSRFFIFPQISPSSQTVAEHVCRWEIWGKIQLLLATVIGVLAKPWLFYEKLHHERWLSHCLSQIEGAPGWELCSLEILFVMRLLTSFGKELNPLSSKCIVISLKEWSWSSTSFKIKPGEDKKDRWKLQIKFLIYAYKIRGCMRMNTNMVIWILA